MERCTEVLMKKNILIGLLGIALLVSFTFGISTSNKYQESQKEQSKLLVNHDSVLYGYSETIKELEARLKSLEMDYEALAVDYEVLESSSLEDKQLIASVKMAKQQLEDRNEALNYFLLEAKARILHTDLESHWQQIWEAIFNQTGEVQAYYIDELNVFFLPSYSIGGDLYINPISCYFTSYYEDISQINLEEYLRYYPKTSMVDVGNMTEFDEISQLDNWPFGDSRSLPVPLWQYSVEDVNTSLGTYSDTKVDQLVSKDYNDLMYLESTQSFYNNTSDFAPGHFTCVRGVVEGNYVKLYGEDDVLVLTIVKKASGYYIESFTNNNM